MPIANPKDNLPLCEFLVKRRKFLKLRFSDLEEKTGISARYLKRIETCDWRNMPSGVYTKGFLRKYARVLGLDEGEVVFRYDQEISEFSQKNVCPAGGSSSGSSFKSTEKELGFFNWVTARFLFAALAVVFAVSYAGWQFKPILERPSLSIYNPKDEDTIITEPVFKMDGQVTPGSVLTINKETVYPEESGSFKKDIELLPGVNVLEIKALSRFGKETKIIKRITYNK